MSEQNPKQNIIRFPLSRRERRQRLLDSKDARIRTTALLRMLCGWALVLGTALFLIANYRIFYADLAHARQLYCGRYSLA